MAEWKNCRRYFSVLEPPTTVAGSWLVTYKYGMAVVTEDARVQQLRPSGEISPRRRMAIVVDTLVIIILYWLGGTASIALVGPLHRG